MWVLGIQPGYSAKPIGALNSWNIISSAHFLDLYMFFSVCRISSNVFFINALLCMDSSSLFIIERFLCAFIMKQIFNEYNNLSGAVIAFIFEIRMLVLKNYVENMMLIWWIFLLTMDLYMKLCFSEFHNYNFMWKN